MTSELNLRSTEKIFLIKGLEDFDENVKNPIYGFYDMHGERRKEGRILLEFCDVKSAMCCRHIMVSKEKKKRKIIFNKQKLLKQRSILC